MTAPSDAFKLPPRRRAERLSVAVVTELVELIVTGQLAEGFMADVVIFDPATVKDNATFTEPHQVSTGMQHVFVNGTHVWHEGRHTGAKPGRIVRGPGWTGRR